VPGAASPASARRCQAGAGRRGINTVHLAYVREGVGHALVGVGASGVLLCFALAACL
jgi:hypothetical protein